MALKELFKKNKDAPIKFKRDAAHEDIAPSNCKIYDYRHNHYTTYTIIYDIDSKTYQLSRRVNKVFEIFSKHQGWAELSLYVRSNDLKEYESTDWNYLVNMILLDII